MDDAPAGQRQSQSSSAIGTSAGSAAVRVRGLRSRRLLARELALLDVGNLVTIVAVCALVLTAATLVWAYAHPQEGCRCIRRGCQSSPALRHLSILSFLGMCHPKHLRASGKLAPTRANGLALVAIWIAGP